MKTMKLCWTIIAIAFVLSGCAAKQELPRFVWPAPPDEPRLEFVGNYYSEQDLAGKKNSELVQLLVGQRPEILFRTPFGIVSDGQGRVYISDLHVHNVWVFDFNQSTTDTISKSSLFESPAGMVLDKSGNLYVADIEKGRIVKFTSEHKYDGKIEGGEMKAPAYLALSPDGQKLYVSEPTAHRILVFELASGKLLRQFGRNGVGEGEFNHPQGLAFGPDGRLFVVDSLNARIQVFDPEGNFLAKFGERGDQAWQLESPKDLAFDSEGHLYVIEARSSVVKTFTVDGQLLLMTGAGKPSYQPFGFHSPKSISIDSSDRIYVAESLGRRFTIWQYMSKEYLQSKPYTADDRQQLLDYMEKIAVEKER